MSRVSWKNNHIGESIIPRNVQGLCGGGELVVWWSSHQCLKLFSQYFAVFQVTVVAKLRASLYPSLII